MRKKITFADVLFIIIIVFSLVVASPYVIRQFMGLTKFGDILWNISYDIVILTVGLLVIYVLDKLINRFLS